MQELRALIREILAQELASLASASKAMPTTCDVVDVADDEALTAFARHLVERANDAEFVQSVRCGQHRFRLAQPPSSLPPLPPRPTARQPVAAEFAVVSSAPPEMSRFERPLLTERDVAALPRDQGRIRVAHNTRLTPLASDELRRRGIRIERLPP